MIPVLAQIEHQLNGAFPERGAVVRGLLAAAIAGEHVLLLGPPGTGKSALSRAFAGATAGGSYFEKLLTKFTVPEEVFGPISFAALKADRYERVTAGYAPDCHVWFLDEIFKASSAILNTLLQAMQERVMVNGAAVVPLPLQTVVAASNEYPQDDSLAALYDRFALRFWVDYLADPGSVRALLRAGGRPAPVTVALAGGDLDALRAQAGAVRLGDAGVETLLAIKSVVEAAGFVASDRTWMRAIGLVRACAVLAGRDHVVGGDYLILGDMLWREHKDQPQLKALIGNAADPYGSRADAIADAVRTAMGDLPAFDLLRTGAKKKTELIRALAEVSSRVVAERDKILTLSSESAGPRIDEAHTTVEAAMGQVDALMRQIMDYRG